MKKFVLFLSVLFSAGLFSQEKDSINNNLREYKISDSEVLVYQKPRISDLYRNIPQNIVGSAKNVVAKNTYWYSLAALGSTLAMIPADPYLIRESRNFGERLGLNEDHSYSNIGPLNIIPNDMGSFFYFLGNGTTVVLMGAGFASYGLLKNDYRAQSTSMQLMQSIILSGVFSQTLKRITGRESPFETDRDGRQHSYWQFMPSFSAFQKNTSKYDAMPSGHLTTGIAAWIVIAENYPEYRWIKPLGFTLMGLMSFEMMQSKVHWASDYPIALLLGYLIGKNVAKNARVRKSINGELATQKKYQFNFSSSTFNGVQMVGINVDF